MTTLPTSSTTQQRLGHLQRTLVHLDRRLSTLQRLSERIGWLRLAVFVIGAAIALLLYASDATNSSAAGTLAIVLTLIGFGVAVAQHRRITRGIGRLRAWRVVKSTHIARIQREWDGLPRPLFTAAPPPIAVDLDLVGERSVQRLLNTATSREGSQRLLDWLCSAPPTLDTIQQRQALVKELTARPLFFDKLTLNGRLAAGREPYWEASSLLAWIAPKPEQRALLPDLRILSALAAVTISLFALSAVAQLPAFWLISLIVYAGFYFRRTRDIGEVFDQALDTQDALQRLGAVVLFLERYPYPPGSQLAKVCAPFSQPQQRLSDFLRQVGNIAAGASITHNAFLWLPINAIVPWDMFFAWRLNIARAQLAERLPTLLDIVFDLEALGGLASFGWLQPEYSTPTFSPAKNAGQRSPHIQAVGLGHPLIRADRQVTNDFTLGQTDQIALLTGSNMAGKSTFLRAVGIGLCMAYAGGVVNASAFEASVMRVFTCIRVSDSVADGYSYFYAEVRRLSALLSAFDSDERAPLFFLIDEMFRGTNSRERFIGSRAYIRSLVGRRGIGILATHDLELVHLADEGTAIVNYHFQDHVVDGNLSFDYTLRSGPCPSTNALMIMKLAGLPTDELQMEQPAS